MGVGVAIEWIMTATGYSIKYPGQNQLRRSKRSNTSDEKVGLVTNFCYNYEILKIL